MILTFRCSTSPESLKLKREIEAILINYLLKARVEPEIVVSISDMPPKINYIFFRDKKLTEMQEQEIQNRIKRFFLTHLVPTG